MALLSGIAGQGTHRRTAGPSSEWLRLSILSLVFLAALTSPLPAATVNLAWDRNGEPDLAGYRLHYGLSSRAYTSHPDVLNPTIENGTVSASLDLPDDGRRYFIAVTALDSNGNQSGFSNEVVYFPPRAERIFRPLPPAGPTNLESGVSYVFTARGGLSNKGHLIQYRFRWSDGRNSGWLPPGAVEATNEWATPGRYVNVRVEARCADHPSVVSPLSEPLTIVVAAAPAETVSQPPAPVGTTAVSTLELHPYAAGGAASSAGHPLEYRLLWADGTVSPWLAAGTLEAAKSWSLPGTYAVRSEARCAQHPTVHSTPSPSLEVAVSAAAGESIPPPAAPAGPDAGLTGLVYGYSTVGAPASNGDSLQYRFQWGDGTATPWLDPDVSGSVRAWKSWPTEGVYFPVAEARCASHPSVPAASAPATVWMTGGSSLLILDSFSDGTDAGDPQWQTLSGRWLVGADKVFTSGNPRAVNRAVVKALPAFRAGRVSTQLRLSQASLSKSTGVVFALEDKQHYRYVSVSGSRIVLGQVGDTPGETAGIKASAGRTFRANQWYRLRVDIHADGLVAAFLGNSTRPVLSHHFADVPAGGIGCLAQQSVASFDDFRAWDARALR